MKRIGIVLLLASLTVFMTSCEQSFSYVEEVTDKTVEAEISRPGNPVVLLIYGNPGSRSAYGWGAVLEEFAQKYGDKLRFLRLNYKENKKWFKPSKSNPLGQIRLYKSGKEIASLKKMLNLMNHAEIGLRGQVFLFLKDYLSKKARDTSRSPMTLNDNFLEKKVQTPGKGISVIAFSKTAECGG